MSGFIKTQQYSLLEQESKVHFLKFIGMGIVVLFSVSITTYIALNKIAPLFVLLNGMVIVYSLNTVVIDFSAYRNRRTEMKQLVLEVMEQFTNCYEEIKARE